MAAVGKICKFLTTDRTCERRGVARILRLLGPQPPFIAQRPRAAGDTLATAKT